MERLKTAIRVTVFLVSVLIVGLIVFIYAPKQVGATYYNHEEVEICHDGETLSVSPIARLIHLRQHEGDYSGACQEPEEPTCDEPEVYVKTEEGGYCEEPEEEVPPVVPPVDVDDDEDNSKCEAPSKVQGFRFQFVGEQNRLRWTPKGSVDKVDIAVYGVDKTTLLYNVRTADDGEYFVPTHTTWHKIRAVGNCGLSKWSKLIN